MPRKLWAGVVASLLLPACGTDSTDVDSNGGTGGSQGGSAGNGGGAAGQGGSAGMAGTAGGGGGTVAARFQVAAEGDRLKVTPRDPVWWLTCSGNLQPAQRVDGSWSVLRDDRPEGSNQHPAAHYLDGTYQSDCSLSLGCDVLVCEQMPTDPERIRDEMYVSTREFVQVGQQAAPTCDEEEQVRLDAGLDAGVLDGGLDAGGRQVPVLEARTPSGTLGMRIRYFPSNDCSGTPLTADVAVE